MKPKAVAGAGPDAEVGGHLKLWIYGLGPRPDHGRSQARVIVVVHPGPAVGGQGLGRLRQILAVR